MDVERESSHNIEASQAIISSKREGFITPGIPTPQTSFILSPSDDEQTNKIWNCRICELDYESEDNLWEHIVTVHSLVNILLAPSGSQDNQQLLDLRNEGGHCSSILKCWRCFKFVPADQTDFHTALHETYYQNHWENQLGSNGQLDWDCDEESNDISCHQCKLLFICPEQLKSHLEFDHDPILNNNLYTVFLCPKDALSLQREFLEKKELAPKNPQSGGQEGPTSLPPSILIPESQLKTPPPLSTLNNCQNLPINSFDLDQKSGMGEHQKNQPMIHQSSLLTSLDDLSLKPAENGPKVFQERPQLCAKCDRFVLIKSEHEKLHQAFFSGNPSLFRCDSCQIAFSSSALYATHCQESHNQTHNDIDLVQEPDNQGDVGQPDLQLSQHSDTKVINGIRYVFCSRCEHYIRRIDFHLNQHWNFDNQLKGMMACNECELAFSARRSYFDHIADHPRLLSPPFSAPLPSFSIKNKENKGTNQNTEEETVQGGTGLLPVQALGIGGISPNSSDERVTRSLWPRGETTEAPKGPFQTWKCDRCWKMINNAVTHRTHADLHDKFDTQQCLFQCDICCMGWDTEGKYLKHLESVDHLKKKEAINSLDQKVGSYDCIRCKNEICSDDYAQHNEAHIKFDWIKPKVFLHRCHLCEMAFESKEDWGGHQAQFHQLGGGRPTRRLR